MPGGTYDPIYWLYFSVWSVAVFLAGVLFFWVGRGAVWPSRLRQEKS